MATIEDFGLGTIDVVNNGRVIRLSAEHRVYAEHDLLREDFFNAFVDSVELTPEDGRMVLDCSSTRVQRYKDGLQFEISGLPEETGAVEDYFRYFTPSKDALVFDLGAYCGVSTYHFAKRCGLVIAVEPDPVNFRCLYSNAIRHQLSNAVCICAAVSDKNGWESFNAEGSLGSSLSHLHPNRLLRGRTSVATRTLESLVDEYGEPDLVKMDVEGSELEILNSCKPLLKELKKTQFVLDTCHQVDGFPTATRVEDIFRECGFAARTSKGGILCTWAWK